MVSSLGVLLFITAAQFALTGSTSLPQEFGVVPPSNQGYYAPNHQYRKRKASADFQKWRPYEYRFIDIEDIDEQLENPDRLIKFKNFKTCVKQQDCYNRKEVPTRSRTCRKQFFNRCERNCYQGVYPKCST